MLDFDIDKEEAQILRTRGVDPQLLYGAKDEYEIETAIKPYKPRSVFVKTTLVGADEQLTSFARLVENPFHKHPRITVIGSFPSDLRAKYAALQIFRTAVEISMQRVAKPRWVQIYGDRLDYEKLRDQRPSLLVITGVNTESTQYKMERLRDVLEMFPDIPRIVVTGGTNDPTEMFRNRLFLPLETGILIGADRTVENIVDIFTGG